MTVKCRKVSYFAGATARRLRGRSDADSEVTQVVNSSFRNLLAQPSANELFPPSGTLVCDEVSPGSPNGKWVPSLDDACQKKPDVCPEIVFKGSKLRCKGASKICLLFRRHVITIFFIHDFQISLERFQTPKTKLSGGFKIILF